MAIDHLNWADVPELLYKDGMTATMFDAPHSITPKIVLMTMISAMPGDFVAIDPHPRAEYVPFDTTLADEAERFEALLLKLIEEHAAGERSFIVKGPPDLSIKFVDLTKAVPLRPDLINARSLTYVAEAMSKQGYDVAIVTGERSGLLFR